jgi:hypothetical protein
MGLSQEGSTQNKTRKEQFTVVTALTSTAYRRPFPSLLCTLILVLSMLFSTQGQQGAFAQSQGDSRTFPETGKTVRSVFLAYWNSHGGLAQQGYPISEEMQEKSDTDGKVYTVQYFERAVFEMHPENQPPNNVLLSLLGVFLYQGKYPSEAPGQTPNNDSGSVVFSETGHRVGGVFLDYWKSHGALAQQGYPISNEFQEKSDLDGKTYRVQYFERAVFEYHPENQPPFDVLLSQLGTFRLKQKQVPSPTSTPTQTPPAMTSTPAPTAVPTNTPISLTDCNGIPDNAGVNIEPRCAELFSRFEITSQGWVGENEVGIYATMPNGQVFGAPFHIPVDNVHGGITHLVYLTVDDETPYYGIWTVTMEGVAHHDKKYGYFKVLPKPYSP